MADELDRALRQRDLALMAEPRSRGVAPRKPGILDIGNGVTERLAFLNQTFNPVEGIGSAMRAGSRMLAPDQSYWDRIASLGEMASGVASIAAPIAAAKAIGVPAASAMMEGLLGFSPARQAAGDMATQFARSESGALPGGGPGRPPLTFDEVARAMQEAQPAANTGVDLPNVKRKDQVLVRIPIEDVEHGESALPGGKLTFPGSRSLIEGYASRETPLPPIDIMSLGDEDFGRAFIADGSHRYEAARLRGDKFIDAYVSRDDLADLPTAQVIETPPAAAPSSFRLYQGSPHDFAAERLVRMPDGSTQYIVGSPNVLPDVPAGAEVLRDFPLGRQRMDKIGTGEGAQAYGYGLYGAEAEGVARGYRDALSRPYLATSEGQNIAEKYGDDVANIFEMAGGEPDDMRATVVRLRQIVKENLDNIGVTDVSQLKSEFYGDLPSTIIDFSNRADRLESLLNSGDVKLVNTGRMYELEVNANPEDFLDWDKPFASPDSLERFAARFDAVDPTLRKRIEDFGYMRQQMGQPMPDGNDIIREVMGGIGSKDAARASEMMREAGIPGIRYLDAGSRTEQILINGKPPERKVDDLAAQYLQNWGNRLGRIEIELAADKSVPKAQREEVLSRAKQLLDEGAKITREPYGTRNYVIFDENLINIVRKYGIAGAATMLGVSALDVEQALAENMSPSQWDQLVVGPQ